MLTEKRAGVAIVALALCALMVLHAPGHMSYDSLVQLDEGFSRKYISWNPPSFSLFLGATYALFGTTSVALLVSQALLLVAVYNLVATPSAPVALRLSAFVSVLAVPIVLIYAGILWKDAFFAHLALAGFAVLNRDIVERRHVLVSAALLGAAATIRQQGIVLVVPLIGYALWLAGTGAGSRALLRWKLAGVAMAGFLAGYSLIVAVVRGTAVDLPAKPYETGVRLLQFYDIVGMLYRDPGAPLDEFSSWPGFDRARLLGFVRRGYSPQRIDYLETIDVSIAGEFRFDQEGDRVISNQWRALVVASPLAYLAHRADVFSWMLGARDPYKCSPFIDLVAPDPPGVAERFGLKPGFHAIAHRVTRQMAIGVFRPYLFLAFGALAVLALFVSRRAGSRKGDRGKSGHMSGAVIPTVYAAGLIYALVHFYVGIACDFRYLYFPVLASIVAVAHVFWEGIASVFGARRRRVGDG